MAETPAQPSQPAGSQDGFLTRQRKRLWNWASGGQTFSGCTRLAAIVLVAIYLGLFVFAVVMAFSNAEGAASFFGYLGDLINIAFTLTGILIVIGSAVVLIQAARFINLLRSEVSPITHDAQEAAKNVRTTSEFVQKQAVEPVIQSQSFLAGVVAFLREIFRLSRLFRKRDDSDTDTDRQPAEASDNE